ncbi:PepSY domain-containing protein [Enteractinococcus fodinae]|uniref:Membrane protein YkoI n=1 Tax=Enteractinococcus fodinae TaxID=684663 RepID=A0ABU2B1G8_9MICC|nr:hypothetical protein [Enteractinococcus fodinae]MDR7347450.1 putative membrane protein YkoI [Enteractinococcus fodinae]
MLTNTNARQSRLFIGIAGAAALGLMTACTTDDAGEQQPPDQEVETVDPNETEQGATDGEQQDATDDAATAEETTPGDTTAEAEDVEPLGGDPVFDVVTAVEAEYADGFIVSIDRDDDDTAQYEVEIVVESELQELDVTAGGEITEDDSDTDDDKIAKAEQATVTVTAALNESFDAHPEATFEQIELDEDGDELRWEVELESAEGSDIDFELPAR